MFLPALTKYLTKTTGGWKDLLRLTVQRCGQSIIVGKSWLQDRKVAIVAIVSAIRKQRVKNASVQLTLSFSVWNSKRWNGTYHIWNLSSHFLIPNIETSSKTCLWVILDPVDNKN